MKLFETLAEDNGAPKSVAQLAAPCNADPLLVCEYPSEELAHGEPIDPSNR
jgi:hypothetical protein